MKIINAKDFIKKISVMAQLSGKKFCFLIGSGCSANCGFPTGSELSRYWFSQLVDNQSFDEYSFQSCELLQDWLKDFSETRNESDHKLYEMLLNEGKLEGIMKHQLSDIDSNPNLFDLIKIRLVYGVENAYGTLVAWRFCNDDLAIHHYFERLNNDVINKVLQDGSPGYNALSQLVSETIHNVVLTVNFDTVLESIVHELSAGKERIIDKYDLNKLCMSGGGFEPQKDLCYIVKLHHSLENSVILNTYVQTRYIEDELLNKVLDPILKEYIPIVIGYSGNDVAIMDYLYRTNALSGIFWLQREQDTCTYMTRKVLEKLGDGRSYLVSNSDDFDVMMLRISDALSPSEDSGKEMIKRDKKIIDKKEKVEINEEMVEERDFSHGPYDYNTLKSQVLKKRVTK